MDYTDLFQLLPQIMPLIPRLTKAVATIEKITAEPDVKDALAAAEQLAAIINKQQAGKAKIS